MDYTRLAGKHLQPLGQLSKRMLAHHTPQCATPQWQPAVASQNSKGVYDGLRAPGPVASCPVTQSLCASSGRTVGLRPPVRTSRWLDPWLGEKVVGHDSVISPRAHLTPVEAWQQLRWRELLPSLGQAHQACQAPYDATRTDATISYGAKVKVAVPFREPPAPRPCARRGGTVGPFPQHCAAWSARACR